LEEGGPSSTATPSWKKKNDASPVGQRDKEGGAGKTGVRLLGVERKKRSEREYANAVGEGGRSELRQANDRKENYGNDVHAKGGLGRLKSEGARWGGKVVLDQGRWERGKAQRQCRSAASGPKSLRRILLIGTPEGGGRLQDHKRLTKG